MTDVDRTAVAWRLAAELSHASSESQAAAAVARAAALLAGAESVRVWLIDRSLGYRFVGAWPEETTAPQAAPEEVARTVIFGAPAATPAPDPYRSRLTIPLLAGPRPLGAVELLERRRPAGSFSPSDASALSDLADAADAALEGIRLAARKESGHLEAIARLTRLFDAGRSISGSLETDELVQVIAGRVQASLEAEAAYVWLANDSGERLSLAASSGPGAPPRLRWLVGRGEGLAGQVAESGQAVLLDDPREIAALVERPDRAAGLTLRSLAAVPIASEDGALLGVLEIVNREGDAPLDEGDLGLLGEIARTAALALQNARRLDAERRASDLGSLLAVTQELGASLDVRKVTFTLVHQAASVIRYRRAAVGLFRGTRLGLAALSGQTFVDETLPETKALRDLLEWAAGLDEGLYVVREEDGSIDTERPEAREKFHACFEATGARSFLAIPLRDDEGRLGAFALEAAEPYAFSDRDIEAAGLLAAQATVAIRNAVLYQQIPMVRVFQPLARGRRRFLGLSRGRRLAWVLGPSLLVAALVLVPVPLRMGGEAHVLPERRLPVTAEVEGRVVGVFVHEGDRVDAGQVIAALDDADYRAGHEDARARFQVALREQSRFRADGRAAAAAVEAARLEGLRAELDLWETRLARTRLRATAAGIIATPRIEEMVGASLDRGDVFCEVVDPQRQRVEVAVPEADAGLVAEGMPVKVKLHAYPDYSFRARVERVGVAATLQEDERVFLVRALLEEAPFPLRSGMTGRAKIDTGRASMGRVLLRRPARWIWGVLWGWMP